MREQFTGFVRRSEGTVVKQVAGSHAEAETWVSEMVRADVEAGHNIVEAGVAKRGGKQAAKAAPKTRMRASRTKRTRKKNPVEGLGRDPRSGRPMTPRLRGRMRG